jgi:arginase
MKYLDAICQSSGEFARGVEQILDHGRFPLLLGGDHSIALGSLAGISAHCRKQKLRLGVLWVDAHTDMNTHETTPSGNIHGMPLSAAMGLGHPKLTGLYGFSPKIEPGNCALLGIRSIDASEKNNIRQKELPLYTMADIDRHGMYHCIAQIIENFKGRIDHLHLSFDLDALDPGIAPGVGTPVPGGINYREAHLVMEALAESGMLSSMEITEANPILDYHNKSAELAVELTVSALGKKIF